MCLRIVCGNPDGSDAIAVYLNRDYQSLDNLRIDIQKEVVVAPWLTD